MSYHSVNYDLVAEVYDERYRGGGLTTVAESLREVALGINAQTAIEIGCGTGHWLSYLRQFCSTCGVDLSMAMLRKAEEKIPECSLICADANRIPLRSHTFDLVYCVNALHHFNDANSFINEAVRLLRPTGALAVVGMDPQAGQDQWYLYDFFQGTLETDLERYPSTERIEKWMQQAGFSRTQHRIAARIRLSFRGRQVFDDSILHKKGTSQLTLLTHEAFLVGMDRIRAAVESDPDRLFTTDVSLYLTIGFTEG